MTPLEHAGEPRAHDDGIREPPQGSQRRPVLDRVHQQAALRVRSKAMFVAPVCERAFAHLVHEQLVVLVLGVYGFDTLAKRPDARLQDDHRSHGQARWRHDDL